MILKLEMLKQSGFLKMLKIFEISTISRLTMAESVESMPSEAMMRWILF